MAAHFLNILCQLVSGNQQVSEYLTRCLQPSDVLFHYKIRGPIRMEILTPRLVLPRLCIKSERRSCYRSQQVPACAWLLHCHQKRGASSFFTSWPSRPSLSSACAATVDKRQRRRCSVSLLQAGSRNIRSWMAPSCPEGSNTAAKTKQSKKLTSVSNDFYCKPLYWVIFVHLVCAVCVFSSHIVLMKAV